MLKVIENNFEEEVVNRWLGEDYESLADIELAHNECQEYSNMFIDNLDNERHKMCP